MGESSGLVGSGRIPEQGSTVLGAQSYQPNGLVRLMPERVRTSGAAQAISKTEAIYDWSSGRDSSWPPILSDFGTEARPNQEIEVPELDSLLYFNNSLVSSY